MPRRLPGVTKYTTKDGRTSWQYVLDLGTDPTTGNRRQRRKRGYATQAEAAHALIEARRAVRLGTYVEPSELRLGEYLHRWLAARAANGLKPKTVASYRQVIDDYIAPHVGEIAIQNLSALALDNLYSTLLATGTKQGGPLSKRTVRYTHTVINAALGDATKKGMLVRNVAELADPPTARASKPPEPETWTPAELALFLEHTAEHRRGVLFHVAAMTGLRRGELCGLRWSDVDLDAAELRVRQTITTPDGIPTFGPPKSARSRRTVSLDAGTVGRLSDQADHQAKARVVVGDDWAETDLVFTNDDGNHIHPDNVSHEFSDAVSSLAGMVKPLSIHGLRHTHATHLLAAGVNAKVVANRLGHHSVAFTLDTYTHVMPGQDADAAEAAACLLRRST